MRPENSFLSTRLWTTASVIFLEFWNFCSTQHRRASKEIFKLDLSSQFQCGHVQYSHVLHLPFQKVSEKRSLDYYMMRFWWLPINAVSNEKTLNFQLKSEKSIIQISSRGGMTEIFRHKIIIWIVCGKGIEIWCFSLYCVEVCKRLYCDNNLAGYTLSFIALVVAITIYLSLRYFARYSQIW